MSTVSCEVCQATTDAPLCQTCGYQVRGWLRDVPPLLAELEVNLTRQSRSDHPGGADPDEDTDGPPTSLAIGATPWVYDRIASERSRSLRTEVEKWARRLATVVRITIPAPRLSAELEAGALALWLAGHVQDLRQQDWAPECHREIGVVVIAARRAIDPGPSGDIVGPCPREGCGQTIYAPATATTVRCRCGQTIDVYQARRALLAAIPDEQIMHGPDACLLLARSGIRLPYTTLRSWQHRGQLTAVGKDSEGWLFRYGDIRALATRPAEVEPA